MSTEIKCCCGQLLPLDAASTRKDVLCPACGRVVLVPLDAVPQTQVKVAAPVRTARIPHAAALQPGQDSSEPLILTVETPQRLKICSVCGESILATSSRCRHCGGDQVPLADDPTETDSERLQREFDSLTSQRKRHDRLSKLLLLCGFAVIVIVGIATGPDRPQLASSQASPNLLLASMGVAGFMLLAAGMCFVAMYKGLHPALGLLGLLGLSGCATPLGAIGFIGLLLLLCLRDKKAKRLKELALEIKTLHSEPIDFLRQKH